MSKSGTVVFPDVFYSTLFGLYLLSAGNLLKALRFSALFQFGGQGGNGLKSGNAGLVHTLKSRKNR